MASSRGLSSGAEGNPALTADQSTEVDIGFTAIEGGTRLTLEHRGWDSLPPDHPARHGMNDRLFLLTKARWWEDHFAALREAADQDTANE